MCISNNGLMLELELPRAFFTFAAIQVSSTAHHLKAAKSMPTWLAIRVYQIHAFQLQRSLSKVIACSSAW